MSLILSKVSVIGQHIRNKRLRNIIAKKLREMNTHNTMLVVLVDLRRHFKPYFRNMSSI
jgi:hypothetical protein